MGAFLVLLVALDDEVHGPDVAAFGGVYLFVVIHDIHIRAIGAEIRCRGKQPEGLFDDG